MLLLHIEQLKAQLAFIFCTSSSPLSSRLFDNCCMIPSAAFGMTAAASLPFLGLLDSQIVLTRCRDK